MDNLSEQDRQLIAAEALLSDRERFCLHAFLRTNDKRRTYLYSREKPPKDQSVKSLDASVSKFFRTEKVQAFLSLHAKEREATTADNNVQLSEASTAEEIKKVYVKELQRIAQSGDDARRIAAIKELKDLQNLKDTNTEGTIKKVVFYLPLRCYACKLYQEAKAKTEPPSL